jgi:DNA-binding NarL/FixJ family response regulator
VLYTLPETAIKSIVREIEYFDIPVNLLVPLANAKKRKDAYSDVVDVVQGSELTPFAINLIEHDHLRRCKESLMRKASECFFIVDEVHKTLNNTERTNVALQIASLSKYFLVLTGTPVIDSNTYKLVPWLEQVVPYEVNVRNFWVAASAMVARACNTGIQSDWQEVETELCAEEQEQYNALVPAALGGYNANPTFSEWKRAADICYDATTRGIVTETMHILGAGRGVMVVAKDSAHQVQIKELLVAKGLRKRDVYILEGGDSIFFTDEAVENGSVPDYAVVITTVRRAEGYTLTRLSAMVTGVYPSNNASRTQLEGRINRICQKQKEVWYRTVHVGLLTSIMRNHGKAHSLAQALHDLAAREA